MYGPPDLLLEENFVPDPDALFQKVVDEVDWDRSMSARLTASFGVPYNYAQMVYPACPMHPLLVPMVERLHARLGVEFNNCLLNYYLDGRGKMGFHSDDTSELRAGTGVAIVSLGYARNLTYRSRLDPEERHAFLLGSGSLLYMENVVQETWVHAIKRQRYAGPRISLTWRAFDR